MANQRNVLLMSDFFTSALQWLMAGAPFAAFWTLLGWGVALGLGIVLWRRTRALGSLKIEQARLQQSLTEFDALRDDLAHAKNQNHDLLLKQRELETTIGERERALKEMRTRLETDFQAIASSMLQQSHNSFLERANETFEKQQTRAKTEVDQLIKPMRETLTRYEQGLRDMRDNQKKSQGELSNQIKELAMSAKNVQAEAARLVTALKSGPKTRGDWGEAQLRNIVEMVGLSPYCDFEEQFTVNNGERSLRPDLVVNLPGGRKLAIDSKVSLNAYMQAVEADTDAIRTAALIKHGDEIWGHVQALARKDYGAALKKDGALDFVIMFVPKESFFAAAMEARPDLIEEAFEKNVLIASPANLIAILKSISLVWRQEKANENAEQVASMARDLYESLGNMGAHLSQLGASLESAVKRYNNVIGSYEGRVLSRARKFSELEMPGTEKSLPEQEPIETDIRKQRALADTPKTGTK